MTTENGSIWATARATTEPVARQALFDAAHEVDTQRTRADAAEAECARLRECLARANATLEATERARYAAEDERDAVLELVATDAVEVARLRDERGAARLNAATLRVALADADLIMEERERQLTAALEAVADERARCAAACREVAARYRVVVCSGPWRVEGEGRGDGARECAEAIERGAAGR